MFLCFASEMANKGANSISGRLAGGPSCRFGSQRGHLVSPDNRIDSIQGQWSLSCRPGLPRWPSLECWRLSHLPRCGLRDLSANTPRRVKCNCSDLARLSGRTDLSRTIRRSLLSDRRPIRWPGSGPSARLVWAWQDSRKFSELWHLISRNRKGSIFPCQAHFNLVWAPRRELENTAGNFGAQV